MRFKIFCFFIGLLGVPSVSQAATASLVVSPTNSIIYAGQSITYSVQSGTPVTWSISPALGSISASGLYTAPASITKWLSVVITAKSTGDQSVVGTTSVGLDPFSPATLSLSPQSSTLLPGESQALQLTVGNANGIYFQEVKYTLSPGVGSISATGVYTAPTTITQPQIVTITAAADRNPDLKATAVIALAPSVSVSAPSVSNLTYSAATITWTSNVAATGTVNYGLSVPTRTSSISGATATTHSITLPSLLPKTTYYYQVASTSDGTRSSWSSSFTTPAVPSITMNAPSISAITANSANISWTTNIPASAIVYYGLSASARTSSTSQTSANSENHSLALANLQAGTTYYYQVESVGYGMTTSWSGSFSTAIAVKLGQARSLPAGFLGANYEDSFGPSGTYQWTDPKTIAATKALGVQSIRYPGGTESNFWDWQKGWFYPAYATAGVGPWANTLTNFAPLAKLSGPPVFDLNVMTYDNAMATSAQNSVMVQNQVAMLQSAQSLGMPIENLELGNEIYLSQDAANPESSVYIQRFSSATDYATQMNYWTQQLKAVFPSALIALSGQTWVSSDNWNADLLATEIGADALTLHVYDDVSTAADPTVLLATALTKWASTNSNDVLPAAAKGLATWITEFDFVDQTSDRSLASTWLHGLFNAEFILEFLSSPSVNLLSIYNLHSDSGISALVYDGSETFGPNGAVTTQAGALSGTGQAFALYGQFLNGAKTVTPLTFSGAPMVTPAAGQASFTPYPSVSGAIANGGPAAKGGLLLINSSSQPRTVDYGVGTAEMQSISAPSLSTNIVTSTSITAESQQTSLSSITLPAYSVSYIH